MSLKVWIAERVRRALTRISPVLNTKITYMVKFHKKLNLDNPKTLNEKNQWLKLNTYFDNELVKQCADKYFVRDYVCKCGLENILNKLLAVYDFPYNIEWEKMPSQFALKLNVGCGFNHIVTDLNKENKEQLNKEISNWIKKAKTQWLSYAEMQYKNVKPYVLVEKYLGNTDKKILPEDYKVYCFNGTPTFVMVCVGREEGKHPKFYFFDKNWHLARINRDSKAAPDGFSLPKPSCFDELMDAAEKLSRPFPFVRADFYIFEEQVIFGELTFTPAGGLDSNRLPETDVLMGNLLKLPQKET